jgi:hypothetical protein
MGLYFFFVTCRAAGLRVPDFFFAGPSPFWLASSHSWTVFRIWHSAPRVLGGAKVQSVCDASLRRFSIMSAKLASDY